MSYDDVISRLGEFGPYQRKIIFLLGLPAILCGFHNMANVFLLAEPDYRCKLPDEPENASYHLNSSLSQNYLKDPVYNKSSSCDIIVNNKTEACDTYIFDHEVYGYTAVIEFELVCQRSYLVATSGSLYMAGLMLGAIGFGELSDRCGRKKTFLICLVTLVLTGLVTAVTPEWWTFNAVRMLVGAANSGVFLVAYVLGLEMVAPSKRFIAGLVSLYLFSVGYMLVALLAYNIDNWRWLQFAMTIPGAVFVFYWWLIPESPRWLLTKNRKDEAKKLIQLAAKYNKVTISEETLDELLTTAEGDEKSKDAQKTSILYVFKYPNMRKRSLIIFFDWFANNLTYYGLSWNSNNLGGNPYLSFVILGAVEIPGYTILFLLINRWGRTKLMSTCMLVAGFSLLLTMAVPADMQWLTLTLAMIGKLAITASYGAVYILSTEQFPTVIRNAGLGAGSTCARFGGIIAPYINELSHVWVHLPLLVFGTVSLIGGCISLILPETLNKKLPETMEEGEMFGR